MKRSELRFCLYGDQAIVLPLLDRHPRLKDAARVVHTEVAIRMDDKPSQALRYGRWKSSMWLALDAVKKGEADVVVTEGFAGNIALKAAEGTAHQFADYLKFAISQSLWSKIGYLLARPAFRMLRDKMDPRKSNGGVFLGLNGVVIKSHGGTDPEGFAAAIDVGYEMVRDELLAKIGETIHRHANANGVAKAIGGAAS
jgi:fatty acid/phospholipid biosynthesis enzyme